jgi:hypothetical protein
MAPKRKGKAWRRANPRDVLARLIAENPKAGKRKLKDEFLAAIQGKDGRDAFADVADYWFEANWEKLKGDQP